MKLSIPNSVVKRMSDPITEPNHPLVWVTKWVDFSSKYGLGFQLCNNVVGVHFNDNTKMIDSVVESQVKYITKPPNANDGETKEMVVIYELANFPAEMKKKITLYKHFKKFFLANKPSMSKDEKTINTEFLQ